MAEIAISGPTKAPEEDDDLEDGEIESDEDDDVVVMPAEPAKPSVSAAQPQAKVEASSPKKKVTPTKPSKHSLLDDQEDQATILERQLAQALGKPEPEAISVHDEDKHTSKSKNRKKKRRNESPPKGGDRGEKSRRKNKRSKDDESGAELDMEYEMLNVRGGSPPPNTGGGGSEGHESDRSDSSCDSYESSEFNQRRRRKNKSSSQRRESKRREKDKEQRRGRDSHHRENNGANDSDREADTAPRRDVYKNYPRKMELCKFYLMECCAKREKCLYMHQDFPCKYYYTGSECTQKDCKFAHGKPLTDVLRVILLKHLETAPKEILGDFPRLGRELALQKIRSRHKELCMKFNVKDEMGGPHHNQQHVTGNFHGKPAIDTGDYSRPPPPIHKPRRLGDGTGTLFDTSSSRKTSRFHDPSDVSTTGANAIPVAAINTSLYKGPPQDPLVSKLASLIPPEQIKKLSENDPETLAQLQQRIGTFGPVAELQGTNMLDRMKEKPPPVPVVPAIKMEKSEPQLTSIDLLPASLAVPPPVLAPMVADTDMRVNKDVDMRFTTVSVPPPPLVNVPSGLKQEPGVASNAVADISQYLREANLTVKEEEQPPVVQRQVYSSYPEEEEDDDDDDDDDKKLKIEVEEEEKDEEMKQEEPMKEEKRPEEPPSYSSLSYWSENLEPVKKIDYTPMQMEEKVKVPVDVPPFVSIYNRVETETEASPLDTLFKNKEKETAAPLHPRQARSRDPRASNSTTAAITIGETPKSPPQTTASAPVNTENPSMYDCDDYGMDDDTTTFGKDKVNISHKPATEEYGSYDTHLEMDYEVYLVDVPKPNFRDIKRRITAPNPKDPRIRRIFRILDEPEPAEPEKPVVANTDPRMRKAAVNPTPPPATQVLPGIDIQEVLAQSVWYNNLGSNDKRLVSSEVTKLRQELTSFHKEVLTGAPQLFDINRLQISTLQVMRSLGIMVDGTGAIQASTPPMLMNDPNMMMPRGLPIMQQQQMFNMNPMNPPAGLLGACPPPQGGHYLGQMAFDGGPPPGFVDDRGNKNFMMGPPPHHGVGGPGNFNDPMGGGFFQQQQQMDQDRMMNNPNSFGPRGGGNYRNNNMNMNMAGGGNRNDRWIHNRGGGGGGGNDNRRHHSRRD